VELGESDDEREGHWVGDEGDEGERGNECRFQTILRCTTAPNSKSAIDFFVFLGLLDLVSPLFPFSGCACFRD